MLPLRTDIAYVAPTGKLTQAGVEAIQGQIDANASRITAAETDITALQDVANEDTGGAAPFYGCRAWVNFNGTGTVAIRASGNVSSITDNGPGDYTINFTTAMTDTNFAVLGTPGAATGADWTCFATTYTTTSVRVVIRNGTNTAVDAEFVNIAIFR